MILEVVRTVRILVPSKKSNRTEFELFELKRSRTFFEKNLNSNF